MLRILWIVATVYSGVVILAVSLYQFRIIAEQIDSAVQHIPGCEWNSTATAVNPKTCQQELGVVATSDQVLTFFFAPWFVALVTSAAHLATVQAASSRGTSGDDNRSASEEGWLLPLEREPNTACRKRSRSALTAWESTSRKQFADDRTHHRVFND